MSIKHASAVWLVLLSLFFMPLVHAKPDSHYSDMSDDNGEENAESFDIEEIPGYVAVRDTAKDIVINVNDNVYPIPQPPIPSVEFSRKSCVALDDEIVALMPLTYRTVPDFYDDPKNAAAIWLTTTGVVLFDIFPDNAPFTEIPFGYALMAYPGYKKYKEGERIRRASLHIESLRRAKARKRCFET